MLTMGQQIRFRRLVIVVRLPVTRYTSSYILNDVLEHASLPLST